MANINSKAGIENQSKKLRIEVPKAPDQKADQYLIGIIRKGLHDHYIDIDFITKKCLEEGLVKIIDDYSAVTDKGKKFVYEYEFVISKKADFKIYNSVEALLMRHTYIFLMEGLDCPCCETPFEEIEGSHIDK